MRFGIRVVCPCPVDYLYMMHDVRATSVAALLMLGTAHTMPSTCDAPTGSLMVALLSLDQVVSLFSSRRVPSVHLSTLLTPLQSLLPLLVDEPTVQELPVLLLPAPLLRCSQRLSPYAISLL